LDVYRASAQPRAGFIVNVRKTIAWRAAPALAFARG